MSLTNTEQLLIDKIVQNVAKTNKTISNTKVIKLAYYCYVWTLVATKGKRKLFSNPPQAWKYGPVFPEVYDYLKSTITKNSIPENIKLKTITLDEELNEILQDVLDAYGHLSGYELSELTHEETPWIGSYNQGENTIIADEAITNFYTSQQVSVDFN